MAKAHELDVIFDHGVFCESPRWHDGALWFSDIGGNKVWRIGPDGRAHIVISQVSMPSGLGWTRDGDLLLVSIKDSTIFKVGADGEPTAFCGPAQHGAIATNDMATYGSRSYVSCGGRVYETGDTIEQISAPIGSVIMVDHETGRARTVAEGYRMPNGIVVTPDGKRIIFSELWASRLLQFDIAPDGSLHNETEFAALDAHADGICLDGEGAIWASTGGGESSSWQRVNAQGDVLDVIPATDGFHAVACWLGGTDGRDLFLVANAMESPEDLITGKARSRMMKTRVEIPAP